MATNGQLTLATTSSLSAARNAGRRPIRVEVVASIAAGLLATALLLVSLPRMAAVQAPIAPPAPMAAPAAVSAMPIPAPAPPAAVPIPAPAPPAAVPIPAPAPLGD